jgi:hypothetical protein
VPVFLFAVIQRADPPWASRLLKWHLRACTWILVLSVVTLIAHWL